MSTSTYHAITEMTVSPSLTSRIAACLATRNISNPRDVAVVRVFDFAAQPGWGSVWAAAVQGYHVNQNPDTGARTDVITDEMIETAVDVLCAPKTYTLADGKTTTKVPDPTLSPEDGGPEFN